MIAGRIIRKKRIEYIDIEKIVTGKFTLRRHFDQEKIDRLTRSVENFGVLQPVTVRKFGKSYELISGERRVMAAKAAGLSTVPAMLVDARFDIAPQHVPSCLLAPCQTLFSHFTKQSPWGQPI